MNWSFSALGCVIFYACALRLVRSPLAELGALLYATVFFAWFSGNVHSTYASQLLFPPLTFYCMLRYREDKRTLWVCAVAVSFSIGAGLRPSDGAFLAPLVLLFFFQLRRKQQVLLALITIAVCAAWFVPTKIAQMQYHPDNEVSLVLLDVARSAHGEIQCLYPCQRSSFLSSLGAGAGSGSGFPLSCTKSLAMDVGTSRLNLCWALC